MSNATRTPQQAMADAIKSGAVQAWIDGKKIQQRWIDNEVWMNGTADVSFTNPDAIWRLAPTPRLRPWTSEEIPATALYKRGEGSTLFRSVSYKDCDANAVYLHDIFVNAQVLCKEWLHSIDGGKTWALCGVQEGGE